MRLSCVSSSALCTSPLAALGVALSLGLFLSLGSGCAADVAPAPGGDAGTADAVSGDLAAPDVGTPDAAPGDAPGDDDAANHADGAGADGAGADVEAPVAPPVTLAPLAVSQWLVATPPTSGANAVGDSLEYGSFSTPSPGVDAYGTLWHETAPDADGALGPFSTPYAYVVAKVQVETTTRVVGRFDNVSSVWVDGTHRQPGELYGGAEPVRVPLVLTPGEHAIVASQARPQRAIRIVLQETSDALHFNLEDVTVPDLVAGAEDAQWIGVHVLNLSDRPLRDVTARVLASSAVEPSATVLPWLAPGAFTAVAFKLVPSGPWVAPEAPAAGAGDAPPALTVRLRLSSPDLGESYERELPLQVVSGAESYQRTFRSPVDGSVQYYGVLAPADPTPEPGKGYGLVLSLHGAGDQAIHANGWYSPKDWTYIISPTNRRRFGFDWEEWGHDNALNALADARAAFPIDPARLHATGVSMGGHGTWHLSVMHPDLFATFTPSAAWRSFYSYTGDPKPTGAFARARAHSETIQYLSNLAGKSIYILHGGEDPVVPVREARDMFALLQPLTDDVIYHEEPGAGHFWQGAQEGTNCADWPPAFAFMRERTREVTPLTFDFRSPAAWYSPTDSYVTVTSTLDPYQDFTLHSAPTPEDPAIVALDTDNVRSLRLDTTALAARGVTSVVVDGEAHAVSPGAPLALGPTTGKQPGLSGPYSQVYRRPFGFVYRADAAWARDYAAFLVSYWAAIGNGQAFALPDDALTPQVEASYNLIFVGLDDDAPALAWLKAAGLPFTWGPDGVSVGAASYPHAALMLVYPRPVDSADDSDGGAARLSAVLYASPGSQHLLYRLIPFSSRGGAPDFLVWTDDGAAHTGFFDADWAWDASLAQ